jgi:hypothetical protein
MALGNVPKHHGLVGILAAVCALPVGCGDEFEGCEASRTCPPPNSGGEAGDTGETGGSAGSGGASGGTTNTGGGSGSGSGGGSSGAAGNDDGGNGGAGGSGEDTPPTIISFSPGDGDADVERDVAVTATFSEPLDEATVTSSSVALEGPDGAVSGTVSLDGNVIAFVPEKPLNLLGSYTLTLDSGIADLAGNTLVQSESAEFRVRDGRWSEATFPFGTTVSRMVTKLQRNAAGDAVLGIDSRPQGTVYGAIYAAAANDWTEATVVPGATGGAASVAIDDAKLAIVAWGTYGAFSWSRLSQGGWVTVGALGSGSPNIAATGGGSATAVWGEPDRSSLSRTLDLTDGSLDPLVNVRASDLSQAWPVASLNRMALIVSRIIDSYTQEVSVLWKEGSSWSNPQPLASAQTEIPYVATDSDEQGNIVVVWRQNDELWARIYQRATDQWIPAHLVGTTTNFATIKRPDITSGNAIVAADGSSATEGLLVGIYQAGVGWVEESVTKLDNHGSTGMALNIDSAGNALAVWQSELKYRRYVAGEGWQAPATLEANVDKDTLFAAGAPDGSVLFIANDLEANPVGAPMAVRFE